MKAQPSAIRREVPNKLRIGWVPVLALAMTIVMISSCGAGGDSNPPSNTGTPPGTYQITVQGESGSLKTSAIVTLIVR